MRQKILAIAIIICFLIIPLSEGASEQHVTFAKYLPDGKIEILSMKISLKNGEAISNGIARVCQQLLLSDESIQKYTNQSPAMCVVVSAGTGFHFNFPSSFFRSSYFNIIYSLFPSILLCSYRTTTSTTDIYSLTAGENTTLIVGPHKLMCLGFVGVVGWTGVFLNGYTGFAGFTPFVFYKTD
jgi:hypothetical protein